MQKKLRLPAFALVVMTSRDKLTGEWRSLRNGKLYIMFSSPNIIWVIKSRWKIGGICSTHGETERGMPAFGGETSGKETAWKT